ncbi:MAG: MBG domain-containing protein, partial [Acidimicrobiales bacterium]
SPDGSYTTSCSGAADPNYTINYVNGTETVNPAVLTITASSESSIYGSAPGAITPSYSGLVNGDTAPATLPSCSTAATASSPVGSYTTSCSGAADPNYTMDYLNGTETVTPATLTVTANSYSRVYHLVNPVFSAAVTGFVNGDTASSISGSASCSTAATISSPVGTYPVTCTTGTLSAENYIFSFSPGVLTITQMPTVLVITSSNTLPDGAVTVTASLTEKLTGAAIQGETVTFTAGSASATGISSPASATLILPNGQYVLGAVFAGDTNYLGSSASQTLYAYQPSNFVVWGGNPGGVTTGQDVNFWGARWSAQVTAGRYSAGASFKGYASSVDLGSNSWTTAPGNASQPPATVSQYISVIVTTDAMKSGATISGNISKIVIVKVDSPAAYASDPGNPANGVVQTTVS